MLREVVGTFLDSLTEREFDAPLLALLASQGFHDIHFIHGSFEFGKDVIAKRVHPDTGLLSQYAIQSKAGDIGQAAWRDVRPQLEEAEYNTRGHPGYAADLPRVAVLLTTGRLKGAAATDAQEYKERAASRGLAGFELWDRVTLADWMCLDPSVGLVGSESPPALMALVADIRSHLVSEPQIEQYTRAWLPTPSDADYAPRAAIEAALIVHELRAADRLDLAALASLHLLRAAGADAPGAPSAGVQGKTRDAARALFADCAEALLRRAEPLLDEPLEFVRACVDALGLVTYPVVACRLAELLALLVVASDDELVVERARSAVLRLATAHPGCHRPPSDQFAVSVIPIVAVVAANDQAAAVAYLTKTAKWLLDRHDLGTAGLGLASLDESEEVTAERLVGGPLECTKLEIRYSSYLTTVLLDLCLVVDGAGDLFDALRENVQAMRIIPCLTAADEQRAQWRRGGATVYWHPRVDYRPWGVAPPLHHAWDPPVQAPDALLLTAVCRSRHYVRAVQAWIAEAPPQGSA